MFQKIEEWHKLNNPNISNLTIFAQYAKIQEELGELARALIDESPYEIEDAIGDTIIAIIGLCVKVGVDPEATLEATFNEIKERSGHLRHGIFVKDGR